jgi:hypothetical protein
MTLLFVVMKNKIKPKAELSNILCKNLKLAWTKDAYTKTLILYFMDLLNVQNVGEDNMENNRVSENGNTSDKMETHVLDLEVVKHR